MSDQIRDVLIRVSVQNGEMKLAAPDVSAVNAALEELEKRIAAVGSSSINLSGGSSSAKALNELAESMKNASSQAVALKATRKEMEDIFNIDIEPAGAPLNFNPVTKPAKTDSHQKQLWSDAQSGIAEWSRHKRKSAIDAASQQEALWSDAQAGIAEWSRHKKKKEGSDDKEQNQKWKEAEQGIAAWSRIKKQQAKEEEEAANERQRSIDEQVAASQKATQATIALTKGISQIAVASGDSSDGMMRAIVMIEGTATAAAAAAQAFGRAGGGLALVASGLVATLTVITKVGDITHAYWKRQIEDQTIVAQRLHGRLTRTDQAITEKSRDSAVFNLRDNDNIATIESRSQHNLNRWFRDSQYEASGGTPAHRDELMRRDEVQNQAMLHLGLSYNNVNRLQTRKKYLEKLPIDEEGRRQDIQDKYRNIRKTVQQGLQDIKNHPAHGALGHSYKQLEQAENLQVMGKNAQIQEAKELKQLTDDVANRKKELLSIDEQISREMVSQNKTGHQMLQDANDAVRAEKDKLKAAQISYGTGNEGDKLMERELQKKFERNESRRKRNLAAGKDENEGLEKYDQVEIETGKRSNNIAMEGIERQAIEEAKRSGIKRRDANVDTVAEAEKYSDHVHKHFGKTVNNSTAEVDILSKSNKEAAESIVKTMKEVFGASEVIAELELQLKNLQSQIQERRTNRGMQ